MSIQKRAKLVPWIAGLALLGLVALTAIPGLAAPTGTKYFKYSVSPSSVGNGDTQTFTVSITNTSPKQSSSNISSVAVIAPPQITNLSATISSASNNGDNSSAIINVNQQNSTNCIASPNGQQVSVCGVAPVKSTKTLVLSITGTVSASVTCGNSANSGPWVVKTNTGSQLNGDNFAIDPAQLSNSLPDYPYPAVTSITKSCNSSISGQVWRDHNNNGSKDGDEAGQKDWTVSLYSGGSLVTSQLSLDDGTYSFTGIGSGTYTICETAPPQSPSYLGWTQSLPSANTLCSGGAEPTGYSVSVGASTTIIDKDFLNVQTITVQTVNVSCNANDPTWPDGGIFTVGNGTTEPFATVTFDASSPSCKPGEYIFESWIDLNGDQQVAFYPNFPPTNNLVPITQSVHWVITSAKTQSTLFYDDGAGKTEAKFCNATALGAFDSMPTANDTTCIMRTTEDATASGVDRHDTIVTLVDGKLTLGK